MLSRQKNFLPRLIALAMALLSCGPIRAQSSGKEPFPVITGDGHLLRVTKLRADPGGRKLLTLGNEGVARIWDLSSGRALQVLRPPRDTYVLGMLYTGVWSPDGALVALVSRLAPSRGFTVYLFDAATGELRRSIGETTRFIMDVTFSPDGKLLARTERGGTKDEGSFLVLHDIAGEYKGGAKYAEYSVMNLTWHATAGLVVTGDRLPIRVYRPEPDNPIGKVSTWMRNASSGREPVVSADARSLAIKSYATVDVYDLQSGEARFSVTLPEQERGAVQGFSISSDANLVLLGGRVDEKWKGELEIWRQTMGKPPIMHTRLLMPARVTAMGAVSPGRHAFGCEDGSFGIIAETGKVEWAQRGAWFGFDRTDGRLLVNADASAVVIDPEGHPGTRLAYSLAQNRLVLSPSGGGVPAGFSAPLQDGFPVKDWFDPKKGSGKALINGKPLASFYYTTQCLAVAPDKATCLLGKGTALSCHGSNGTQVWTHALDAWPAAINLSKDGKLAVVACNDGSIRWFATEPGLTAAKRELLRLHPCRDGKRWVIFTPQTGYYDASPEGHDLLGMQDAGGNGGTGKHTPMSQLKAKYHRPDILWEVWRTRDSSAADGGGAKPSNASSAPPPPPPPRPAPAEGIK